MSRDIVLEIQTGEVIGTRRFNLEDMSRDEKMQKKFLDLICPPDGIKLKEAWIEDEVREAREGWVSAARREETDASFAEWMKSDENANRLRPDIFARF